MGLSVQERWKKGDRWFLALVDPLLDKPAYFALTKDRVTVGFQSGYDCVLPCGQMGLDMIADSSRLDSSYNRMCAHAACNSWPEQGPIGERTREPFFELTFERGSVGQDTSWDWSASCHEGHDCRVSRSLDLSICSKPYWDADNVGRNPASDVFDLCDGDVFEFVWPYFDYKADDERCSYNLPPQRLRFVFVEELAGTKTTHLGNACGLTSLPIVPLALMASFLEPEEFLRTLAVVSPIFTSASMRQQIPWKNLELTNTFDSLRIPRMACPGAIRRITALKPWDKYQRYAIYLKWKPLITQETVLSLEIEDPCLLCSTGIPANLEEITFVANDEHLAEFWSALYHLSLPASTKNLKIRCTNQCLLRSVGGTYVEETSVNELESSQCYLDVEWLCQFMQRIQELHLENIPFQVESWKTHQKAVIKLKNLRRLSVNNMNQDFSLLRCTSNLTTLDITVKSDMDADQIQILSGNKGWNTMKSFTLRNQSEYCLHSFINLMPNLIHLRLTGEDEISAEVIMGLPDLVPKLKVLSIRHAAIGLHQVVDLVKRFMDLIDLKILISDGSVQGVSHSSFSRGDGVTVRWETWKEPGKPGEKFNFSYSKVTNDHLEKFMEEYSIEWR